MEQKKNKAHRIEQRIPFHFLIGLNVALGLTLMAFEWKSEEGPIVLDGPFIEGQEFDETIYLPPPPPPTPPPPSPKLVKPVEVPDDTPVEVPPDVVINSDPPDEVPPIYFEPIDDEPVDEPKDIVDVDVEFPGGWEAFYNFVGDKMKYPNLAIRTGTEGKVFAQFIIEKDGSLTDIKIIKGIGAGCDEEAIRVLKLVPNFKPAWLDNQRVRKRMVLPITFRIN